MQENIDNNHLNDFNKMPLFIKAEEIRDIAFRLTELISDETEDKLKGIEKELAQQHINFIHENALILPAKIAASWSTSLYDLRMENAALIRRAGREIQINCAALNMFDFKSLDYLDLLIEELEAFRILFANWVKTFDPWDYCIDRWGLFNPPGVNFDDKDPDDDLPFDGFD